MKTIDCSDQVNKPEKPARLGRVLGGLGLDMGQNEAKAQELAVQLLQKVLDNRFICLQNLPVEGFEQPLPLLLLGPGGVWAIGTSGNPGIFRASGSNWEELDSHSRKFRIAKPNLISNVLQMASRVQKKVSISKLPGVHVEPVLFFASPGAHVDASNSAVRIVLLDAIERFGATLAAKAPVMHPEEIEEITSALSGANDSSEGALELRQTRDVFSLREPADKLAVKAIPLPKVSLQEPRALKKIRFTRKQWIVLGVMVIVNILVLAALVMVLLVLS